MPGRRSELTACPWLWRSSRWLLFLMLVSPPSLPVWTAAMGTPNGELPPEESLVSELTRRRRGASNTSGADDDPLPRRPRSPPRLVADRMGDTLPGARSALSKLKGPAPTLDERGEDAGWPGPWAKPADSRSMSPLRDLPL